MVEKTTRAMIGRWGIQLGLVCNTATHRLGEDIVDLKDGGLGAVVALFGHVLSLYNICAPLFGGKGRTMHASMKC